MTIKTTKTRQQQPCQRQEGQWQWRQKQERQQRQQRQRLNEDKANDNQPRRGQWQTTKTSTTKTTTTKTTILKATTATARAMKTMTHRGRQGSIKIHAESPFPTNSSLEKGLQCFTGKCLHCTVVYTERMQLGVGSHNLSSWPAMLPTCQKIKV